MPWGVKKENDKWLIYRKDSGKVVGHSDSKEKAMKSVAVREQASKGEGIKNMFEFVHAVCGGLDGCD